MASQADLYRQVPCMHVFPDGKCCDALHGEKCRDEDGNEIDDVHEKRHQRAERAGVAYLPRPLPAEFLRRMAREERLRRAERMGLRWVRPPD